ncbi:hypothetical protein K7432_003746 [Basidiobolus ranarum]|uniref:Uncharacterized protein n=1 Tax=Basidiobolus ranarum TaxID=34480 RepID=A0ABR2WZ99_9FUNG
MMIRSLRILCLSALLLAGQVVGDDVNSVCSVYGFKVSFSKIKECCLQNMGGSNFQGNHLICTLPTVNEGLFRRCVKKLGYATSVDCEY